MSGAKEIIDEDQVKMAIDVEKMPAIETFQSPGDKPGHSEEMPQNWDEVKDMRQGLHQRHIQMIALAGSIGTGLFLGSGAAIAQAGPLGAFMGYTFTGILVAAVVFSTAEMGALMPLTGGIIRYCSTFVDPALSFANGWNQVYSGLIGIPAEIVAASILIEYWISLNNAIWITVFGAFIAVNSLLFVRVYGELEFGFAWLKILLIIMINILAIVIAAGGGPNHQVIGFKYWSDPGPFVQYLGYPGALGRFLGFWAVFNNSAYAYGGSEAITLAAAEVKNPRQAIPLAAKRIFWRILLFYVISIFMTGMVVPSNNPQLLTASGTAASPFVIAAETAGIRVIPHVINAIVITSAWSSGNGAMLNYSRILFGMAKDGYAPKLFLRLNRFSIPWVAVLLYVLFMSLGYMTLSNNAAVVFTWLQDLVAISNLVNWSIILITYLRFYYGCKAQGISRDVLPFRAPFQPYFSWAALFMFSLIILTSGWSTFTRGNWDTQTFISSYFNIPFILMLYLGYKFWKKTKLVSLPEIPIQPLIQRMLDYPEPPPEPRTGLQRFNFLWS